MVRDFLFVKNNYSLGEFNYDQHFARLKTAPFFLSLSDLCQEQFPVYHDGLKNKPDTSLNPNLASNKFHSVDTPLTTITLSSSIFATHKLSLNTTPISPSIPTVTSQTRTFLVYFTSINRVKPFLLDKIYDVIDPRAIIN